MSRMSDLSLDIQAMLDDDVAPGATGVVKKIAIKYVTVRHDRDGTMWKIPANMLEVVEGQMATA